jgi:6-phosphogluconolactonase
MTSTDGRLALVAAKTGAEEDGLYSYRADPDTGGLDFLSSIPVGGTPKFLAVGPDGRRCYVVDTTDDGGSVASVAVDRETGALSVANRVPSGGEGPCYCSVDRSGRYVFVAHYSSGSVAVLPVDADGRAEEPAAVVEHSGSGADPDRQEAPHPHSVEPGPENRFVYVPDLGTDEVRVYEFDREAGDLRPADPPAVTLPGGRGPRHVDFGPAGEFAYLVGELDSTLTTLARDPETGALSVVETVSTLPEGFDGENQPADVHVHPSGEWVYASNRGHDSIAVFEVDDGGRTGPRVARPVAHESTRGSWPRDFAVGPGGRYLYAENQNSDSVVVFRTDGDPGKLAATGAVVDVPRPGCLAFTSGP